MYTHDDVHYIFFLKITVLYGPHAWQSNTATFKHVIYDVKPINYIIYAKGVKSLVKRIAACLSDGSYVSVSVWYGQRWAQIHRL